MGQVLQAGAGQIPSRQAAVAAGIPMTVPVADDQQGVPVRAGRDRAGRPADPGRRVRRRGGRRHGVDEPGAAPAARGAPGVQVRLGRAARRHGPRRADRRVRPPLDGRVHRTAQRRGSSIGRAEQDEFAARSHQRAAEAIKNGLLADEIVAGPRAAAARRSGDLRHRRGRAGRHARRESLGRLRPAFGADGTITAGSASQISDGACAVVVMSAEAAAAAGAPVLAEIGAHGVRGRARTTRCSPSRPTRSPSALGKAGLTVADLDLIEINEAFAAVAIQSMRDLGVGPDRVNVNGGAIAIGHPIGDVRAPGSPCTWPTSCGAAAAAWARPRCAAAAARATRCCCGCPRRALAG